MTLLLRTVPIDRIRIAAQVRKHFDGTTIAELAGSIGESGLQHPPLCYPEDEQYYSLIDGERRVRACLQLEWKDIPILIATDQVSAVEVLTRQLACNLQREDLTAVERAEAIRLLMQQADLTADQVAKRLGQSPATVSRTLSVLKLPAALLSHVACGRIPADSAYALARVDDPEVQAQLAAEVMGSVLTRDGLLRKLKRVRRARIASEKGPDRVTAPLGGGRSITLAGKGLSWESLVESLEQLLSRARKAKSQGLSLTTFVRTLRDQANS